MVHPNTELRFVSPAIGWGVFATRFIPRGTIVWALDALDQKFSPAQAAALPAHAREKLAIYAYRDARGHYVLCWDHARFFNHACDANCLSAGYDFELAIRDIHPGDELTDDYGTLNPTEPFPCLCGASNCRGQVLPDDMRRLKHLWNERSSAAFRLIRSVEQPLWPVVNCQHEILAALAEPEKLRPIELHYHELARAT